MSIFDEFTDRFSGRYFGKYRGVVSRIDDPKKMGRIMAKVPVVLGTEYDIGWALPTPPVGGGRNVGFIAHPAVGDYVWIEFEEGDPEKSLWSAGPWPLGAQKKSFMPNHGKGEADNTDYSMRDFGNIPPSQFEGEYGKVVCLQGHDGSFLEFDGTDGAHRVQLSHYTGTRIEMTNDGSYQEAVAGMTRRRCSSHEFSEVGGMEVRNICGDRKFEIGGMNYETFSRGSSQLFGFRVINYPGLDPAELEDPSLYYDENGDPIYMPANLKQKGGAYTGIWDNSVLYKVGGQFSVSCGGNMQLMCGSGYSMMSMSGTRITASEGLELTGMAATGGDVGTKTTKPVLLYGYNGVSEFASFDLTGLVACSGVVADPGFPPDRPNPSLLLFSHLGAKTQVDTTGIVNGGSIKILGIPTPGPNVFFGGDEITALLSLPICDVLITSILTPLLVALSAHTHTSAVGETGPSAALTAAIPAIQASNTLPVLGSKLLRVML